MTLSSSCSSPGAGGRREETAKLYVVKDIREKPVAPRWLSVVLCQEDDAQQSQGLRDSKDSAAQV